MCALSKSSDQIVGITYQKRGSDKWAAAIAGGTRKKAAREAAIGDKGGASDKVGASDKEGGSNKGSVARVSKVEFMRSTPVE